MGLILLPRVESDYSVVTAMLPYGSPLSRAEAVRDRLTAAIEAVAREHGGNQLLKGVFAVINENQVEVTAYLTGPEVRPLSTREVTQLWRQQIGPIPGVVSVQLAADRGGPGSGAALSLELRHRHIESLDQASAALAGRYYIVTDHHTPRVFVERCSVISALGFGDGSAALREKLKLPGKGPKYCITPLCVFDFAPDTNRMRLHSLHPRVPLDQVMDNTSFEPEVPDPIATTEPPTARELEILRQRVDPEGLLR